MSTTIHHGTCQFCGYTLQLHIDDACPIRDAQHWISMAACDRCADFRLGLLKAGDYCRKAVEPMFDARGTKREKEVESEVRNKVEEASRRIMRMTCDHYRVTYHWSPEFVDELLEHPSKAHSLIALVRRRVEQSARNARNARMET